MGSRYGHDGQQFYVIARTLPDLARADGHVDRLRYRARRILFPLVVAPLPAGAATVWGMLAVNLLAVGAAALALSRLALRLGLAPWLGALAGITPALLVSANAVLADALGIALAVWGVVLWRRHIWWAVLLFTFAVLAREQLLVAPAVCGLAALLERPRRWVWPLLVTPAVYAGWSLVVGMWLPQRARAGESGPLGDALRQFVFPFRAWIDVGPATRPIVAGAALALGSLIAAWTLRRVAPEVALWLVADTLLIVISSRPIAGELLNYVRVAPLAVPAMGMAIAIGRLPEMRAQAPPFAGRGRAVRP
jgi:hypothetical protein